jgi:quinol monooxygenase YgiN
MYDLHKDPEVPNSYYFLERFKSVKAMEDHIGESHTAKLLEKFGTDLTKKPRITILDKISPDRK